MLRWVALLVHRARTAHGSPVGIGGLRDSVRPQLVGNGGGGQPGMLCERERPNITSDEKVDG